MNNDFWRHLLIGGAVATAGGLISYLNGLNFSQFGAYQWEAQLAAQLLTEAYNQWKGVK